MSKKSLLLLFDFNNNNMNIILAILIFCIVLFIYIHIYYHLKKCDDLEIYEIQQPSKERLEEICDLRQPVIFDFEMQSLQENCNLKHISENYGAFDIKVRNIKENDDTTDLFIPVALNSALQAFEGDNNSKFLSENNNEFLEETSLIKCLRYNDSFLRPYMVSKCIYDLQMGSRNVESPFRFELNYRNYFIVTEGEAIFKIAPPKSSRYLYPIYDYDNFEFKSPINPWNIQSQYKLDFNKIKCLEIKLKPGYVLFLPAYWWYSVKLTENTSICSFKYRTYMNTLAILPEITMSMLQRQNTKHKVANVISSKETDNDINKKQDKEEKIDN